MKIYQFITACALSLTGPLSATSLAAQDTTDEMTPADIVTLWEADRSTVFEGAAIDLDALKWIARPVVVFADSPFDPSFIQQMEFLLERTDELAERDVIIVADTDTANPSPLRLKLRPRGFMMTLVGKDGQVKMRKPSPWDVRELTRSIDKIPMRQQEVSERRALGN